MSSPSPKHVEAVARFEELKERQQLCCEKLESLNRMLHRLSPSDHLFGAVIRGIAKRSCEQIAIDDALWQALAEVNRSAAPAGRSRPHLVLVS